MQGAIVSVILWGAWLTLATAEVAAAAATAAAVAECDDTTEYEEPLPKQKRHQLCVHCNSTNSYLAQVPKLWHSTTVDTPPVSFSIFSANGADCLRSLVVGVIFDAGIQRNTSVLTEVVGCHGLTTSYDGRVLTAHIKWCSELKRLNRVIWSTMWLALSSFRYLSYYIALRVFLFLSRWGI